MADERDMYYPLKNLLIGIPPRVVWNGTCGLNHDGHVDSFMNLQPPLYKKLDEGSNHYA